jgi:hypothetical protein
MSETIYLGTDEIRLSAGKFRTTRRYIRSGGAVTFYIPKGRTLNVVLDGNIPKWRYAVGSYAVDGWGLGGFNASVAGCTL